MGAGVAVPLEAIATLRRRLAALPSRHPERQALLASTAGIYNVSRATLYRLLRGDRRPKDAHRSDRGQPRVMASAELERWCEIVAAMKVRTTNKKGRCLSNARILELLVDHGVETPDGLQKLAPGRLTASTLNRHIRRLGYDHARMTREPPAVRFQAERSNALWHFDMSPSDLKQLETSPWIDLDRQGAPTLMLFSAVDDRSGVAYQEYRCVYGEDVETALRFLFNVMTAKAEQDNPLQGIPDALYLDNGPVGKSEVFKRVMESLGVEVLAHMPRGTDGRSIRVPYSSRKRSRVGVRRMSCFSVAGSPPISARARTRRALFLAVARPRTAAEPSVTVLSRPCMRVCTTQTRLPLSYGAGQDPADRPATWSSWRHRCAPDYPPPSSSADLQSFAQGAADPGGGVLD